MVAPFSCPLRTDIYLKALPGRNQPEELRQKMEMEYILKNVNGVFLGGLVFGNTINLLES